MPLTLTEIQLINNGIPKPEATSLRDLTALAGIRHYNWFEANKAATDPETLARAYVDKMLNVTRQMVTRNVETAKTVTLNLIVTAGNTTNYEDVQAYSTTQWEAFVENNIVTALEVAAGITTEEKTAYNAL